MRPYSRIIRQIALRALRRSSPKLTTRTSHCTRPSAWQTTLRFCISVPSPQSRSLPWSLLLRCPTAPRRLRQAARPAAAPRRLSARRPLLLNVSRPRRPGGPFSALSPRVYMTSVLPYAQPPCKCSFRHSTQSSLVTVRCRVSWAGRRTRCSCSPSSQRCQMIRRRWRPPPKVRALTLAVKRRLHWTPRSSIGWAPLVWQHSRRQSDLSAVHTRCWALSYLTN
mmetsp:Transcript_54728/g.108635  ORF Transcript_54728/g.108635 Transcript_54728/m.108635 type:complete len:223 (-) Transcript_54728:40-708(-)